MTWDGSALRLYVDGAEVAAAARAGAADHQHRRSCASAATACAGQFFSGLIDEVRIYNDARTAGRDRGRHERSRSPSPDRH